MYEIIKHTAKKSTVLFTSPCETIARARFYKSAALLKINETLELRHDGQVVHSIKACGYSAGSKTDEDREAIFPETSGTLKDTCNVSGLLPAQFRASPVDCGIGWKEHAKQEPRKAKAESVALEMKEQLEACLYSDKAKVSLGDVAVSVKTGSSSVRLDGPSYWNEE